MCLRSLKNLKVGGEGGQENKYVPLKSTIVKDLDSGDRL